MKNTKKYLLRGVGAGVVVYILFFIVCYILIFKGAITCNILTTTNSGIQESFLCTPILTLTGIPLMIMSEFFEDISNGTITHIEWYSGLILSVFAYFAIFALLGSWYGKIKNKNKV